MFLCTMLICKVYNFWRLIISTKLNQMKHMTPSSCNPCQKFFNAIVNLFNQTWFGFQISLWMVGSLFANTIKNYIFFWFSWCNTTFLLKSLRSSKNYKIIKLKHVSTLQTLFQIRKNQQATNYLNFFTTFEIRFFFFKHSIFFWNFLNFLNTFIKLFEICETV
jgi:hypothetical protein